MAIESIGSVLKKKGHEICSVAPDATVYDAIALMAAKNVAASWSSQRAIWSASSLHVTMDARSFSEGNPQATCGCERS